MIFETHPRIPHTERNLRLCTNLRRTRPRNEEQHISAPQRFEKTGLEFIPLSLSLCSYGNRVEHFRVLKGGGQYCIWEESFCSLNRLVDFYRTHSIAVDKVVCLRDPPSSPQLQVQAGCNPYPNPYKNCSQESLHTAHLHSHHEREASARLLDPGVRQHLHKHSWWKSECVFLIIHFVLVCVCRKPAWLTPSVTTPPLTRPTCTSCVGTSSTCWTARAPWAGGGAVEVGWGSFRRRASSLFTTDAISNWAPSQPWRWPSDSCLKPAHPVISSSPVKADLATFVSKSKAFLSLFL